MSDHRRPLNLPSRRRFGATTRSRPLRRATALTSAQLGTPHPPHTARSERPRRSPAGSVLARSRPSPGEPGWQERVLASDGVSKRFVASPAARRHQSQRFAHDYFARHSPQAPPSSVLRGVLRGDNSSSQYRRPTGLHRMSPNRTDTHTPHTPARAQDTQTEVKSGHRPQRSLYSSLLSGGRPGVERQTSPPTLSASAHTDPLSEPRLRRPLGKRDVHTHGTQKPAVSESGDGSGVVPTPGPWQGTLQFSRNDAGARRHGHSPDLSSGHPLPVVKTHPVTQTQPSTQRTAPTSSSSPVATLLEGKQVACSCLAGHRLAGSQPSFSCAPLTHLLALHNGSEQSERTAHRRLVRVLDQWSRGTHRASCGCERPTRESERPGPVGPHATTGGGVTWDLSGKPPSTSQPPSERTHSLAQVRLLCAVIRQYALNVRQAAALGRARDRPSDTHSSQHLALHSQSTSRRPCLRPLHCISLRDCGLLPAESRMVLRSLSSFPAHVPSGVYGGGGVAHRDQALVVTQDQGSSAANVVPSDPIRSADSDRGEEWSLLVDLTGCQVDQQDLASLSAAQQSGVVTPAIRVLADATHRHAPTTTTHRLSPLRAVPPSAESGGPVAVHGTGEDTDGKLRSHHHHHGLHIDIVDVHGGLVTSHVLEDATDSSGDDAERGSQDPRAQPGNTIPQTTQPGTLLDPASVYPPGASTLTPAAQGTGSAGRNVRINQRWPSRQLTALTAAPRAPSVPEGPVPGPWSTSSSVDLDAGVGAGVLGPVASISAMSVSEVRAAAAQNNGTPPSAGHSAPVDTDLLKEPALYAVAGGTVASHTLEGRLIPQLVRPQNSAGGLTPTLGQAETASDSGSVDRSVMLKGSSAVSAASSAVLLLPDDHSEALRHAQLTALRERTRALREKERLAMSSRVVVRKRPSAARNRAGPGGGAGALVPIQSLRTAADESVTGAVQGSNPQDSAGNVSLTDTTLSTPHDTIQQPSDSTTPHTQADDDAAAPSHTGGMAHLLSSRLAQTGNGSGGGGGGGGGGAVRVVSSAHAVDYTRQKAAHKLNQREDDAVLRSPHGPGSPPARWFPPPTSSSNSHAAETGAAGTAAAKKAGGLRAPKAAAPRRMNLLGYLTGRTAKPEVLDSELGPDTTPDHTHTSSSVSQAMESTRGSVADAEAEALGLASLAAGNPRAIYYEAPSPRAGAVLHVRVRSSTTTPGSSMSPGHAQQRALSAELLRAGDGHSRFHNTQYAKLLAERQRLAAQPIAPVRSAPVGSTSRPQTTGGAGGGQDGVEEAEGVVTTPMDPDEEAKLLRSVLEQPAEGQSEHVDDPNAGAGAGGSEEGVGDGEKAGGGDGANGDGTVEDTKQATGPEEPSTDTQAADADNNTPDLAAERSKHDGSAEGGVEDAGGKPEEKEAPGSDSEADDAVWTLVLPAAPAVNHTWEQYREWKSTLRQLLAKKPKRVPFVEALPSEPVLRLHALRSVRCVLLWLAFSVDNATVLSLHQQCTSSFWSEAIASHLQVSVLLAHRMGAAGLFARAHAAAENALKVLEKTLAVCQANREMAESMHEIATKAERFLHEVHRYRLWRQFCKEVSSVVPTLQDDPAAVYHKIRLKYDAQLHALPASLHRMSLFPALLRWPRFLQALRGQPEFYIYGIPCACHRSLPLANLVQQRDQAYQAYFMARLLRARWQARLIAAEDERVLSREEMKDTYRPDDDPNSEWSRQVVRDSRAIARATVVDAEEPSLTHALGWMLRVRSALLHDFRNVVNVMLHPKHPGRDLYTKYNGDLPAPLYSSCATAAPDCSMDNDLEERLSLLDHLSSTTPVSPLKDAMLPKESNGLPVPRSHSDRPAGTHSERKQRSASGWDGDPQVFMQRWNARLLLNDMWVTPAVVGFDDNSGGGGAGGGGDGLGTRDSFSALAPQTTDSDTADSDGLRVRFMLPESSNAGFSYLEDISTGCLRPLQRRFEAAMQAWRRQSQRGSDTASQATAESKDFEALLKTPEANLYRTLGAHTQRTHSHGVRSPAIDKSVFGSVPTVFPLPPCQSLGEYLDTFAVGFDSLYSSGMGRSWDMLAVFCLQYPLFYGLQSKSRTVAPTTEAMDILEEDLVGMDDAWVERESDPGLSSIRGGNIIDDDTGYFGRLRYVDGAPVNMQSLEAEAVWWLGGHLGLRFHPNLPRTLWTFFPPPLPSAAKWMAMAADSVVCFGSVHLTAYWDAILKSEREGKEARRAEHQHGNSADDSQSYGEELDASSSEQSSAIRRKKSVDSRSRSSTATTTAPSAQHFTPEEDRMWAARGVRSVLKKLKAYCHCSLYDDRDLSSVLEQAEQALGISTTAADRMWQCDSRERCSCCAPGHGDSAEGAETHGDSLEDMKKHAVKHSFRNVSSVLTPGHRTSRSPRKKHSTTKPRHRSEVGDTSFTKKCPRSIFSVEARMRVCNVTTQRQPTRVRLGLLDAVKGGSEVPVFARGGSRVMSRRSSISLGSIDAQSRRSSVHEDSESANDDLLYMYRRRSITGFSQESRVAARGAQDVVGRRSQRAPKQWRVRRRYLAAFRQAQVNPLFVYALQHGFTALEWWDTCRYLGDEQRHMLAVSACVTMFCDELGLSSTDVGVLMRAVGDAYPSLTTMPVMQDFLHVPFSDALRAAVDVHDGVRFLDENSDIGLEQATPWFQNCMYGPRLPALDRGFGVPAFARNSVPLTPAGGPEPSVQRNGTLPNAEGKSFLWAAPQVSFQLFAGRPVAISNSLKYFAAVSLSRSFNFTEAPELVQSIVSQRTKTSPVVLALTYELAAVMDLSRKCFSVPTAESTDTRAATSPGRSAAAQRREPDSAQGGEGDGSGAEGSQLMAGQWFFSASELWKGMEGLPSVQLLIRRAAFLYAAFVTEVRAGRVHSVAAPLSRRSSLTGLEPSSGVFDEPFSAGSTAHSQQGSELLYPHIPQPRSQAWSALLKHEPTYFERAHTVAHESGGRVPEGLAVAVRSRAEHAARLLLSKNAKTPRKNKASRSKKKRSSSTKSKRGKSSSRKKKARVGGTNSKQTGKSGGVKKNADGEPTEPSVEERIQQLVALDFTEDVRVADPMQPTDYSRFEGHYYKCVQVANQSFKSVEKSMAPFKFSSVMFEVGQSLIKMQASIRQRLYGLSGESFGAHHSGISLSSSAEPRNIRKALRKCSRLLLPVLMMDRVLHRESSENADCQISLAARSVARLMKCISVYARGSLAFSNRLVLVVKGLVRTGQPWHKLQRECRRFASSTLSLLGCYERLAWLYLSLISLEGDYLKQVLAMQSQGHHLYSMAGSIRSFSLANSVVPSAARSARSSGRSSAVSTRGGPKVFTFEEANIATPRSRRGSYSSPTGRRSRRASMDSDILTTRTVGSGSTHWSAASSPLHSFPTSHGASSVSTLLPTSQRAYLSFLCSLVAVKRTLISLQLHAAAAQALFLSGKFGLANRYFSWLNVLTKDTDIAGSHALLIHVQSNLGLLVNAQPLAQPIDEGWKGHWSLMLSANMGMAQRICGAFVSSRVVVFSGHMLDSLTRSTAKQDGKRQGSRKNKKPNKSPHTQDRRTGMSPSARNAYERAKPHVFGSLLPTDKPRRTSSSGQSSKFRDILGARHRRSGSRRSGGGGSRTFQSSPRGRRHSGRLGLASRRAAAPVNRKNPFAEVFPAGFMLENAVQGAIEAVLQKVRPKAAYCFVSCGADIIFAEQAMVQSVEVHLVIPFQLQDFLRSSVDYGQPALESWRLRCLNLIQSMKVHVHYVTTEAYLHDPTLYRFGLSVMRGLAILRSRELGQDDPLLITLLDSNVANYFDSLYDESTLLEGHIAHVRRSNWRSRHVDDAMQKVRVHTEQSEDEQVAALQSPAGSSEKRTLPMSSPRTRLSLWSKLRNNAFKAVLSNRTSSEHTLVRVEYVDSAGNSMPVTMAFSTLQSILNLQASASSVAVKEQGSLNSRERKDERPEDTSEPFGSVQDADQDPLKEPHFRLWKFVSTWRMTGGSVKIIDLSPIRGHCLAVPRRGKDLTAPSLSSKLPSRAAHIGSKVRNFLGRMHTHKAGGIRITVTGGRQGGGSAHKAARDTVARFKGRLPSLRYASRISVFGQYRSSYSDRMMAEHLTMGAKSTAQWSTLGAVRVAENLSRVIRFMIFASVSNMHLLREAIYPKFFRDFWKLVYESFLLSNTRPLYTNSWGVALYFVFRDVVDAVRFAVTMLNVFQQKDWSVYGLPKHAMKAKIGLHAGPVFPGFNPVIRKHCFFGEHVCRTARIKAVAGHGQALASEQFVAAFAAEERMYIAAKRLARRPEHDLEGGSVLPVYSSSSVLYDRQDSGGDGVRHIGTSPHAQSSGGSPFRRRKTAFSPTRMELEGTVGRKQLRVMVASPSSTLRAGGDAEGGPTPRYADGDGVDMVEFGGREVSQVLFEYIGRRPLAKGYDTCPLYRVCDVVKLLAPIAQLKSGETPKANFAVLQGLPSCRTDEAGSTSFAEPSDSDSASASNRGTDSEESSQGDRRGALSRILKHRMGMSGVEASPSAGGDVDSESDASPQVGDGNSATDAASNRHTVNLLDGVRLDVSTTYLDLGVYYPLTAFSLSGLEDSDITELYEVICTPFTNQQQVLDELQHLYDKQTRTQSEQLRFYQLRREQSGGEASSSDTTGNLHRRQRSRTSDDDSELSSEPDTGSSLFGGSVGGSSGINDLFRLQNQIDERAKMLTRLGKCISVLVALWQDTYFVEEFVVELLRREQPSLAVVVCRQTASSAALRDISMDASERQVGLFAALANSRKARTRKFRKHKRRNSGGRKLSSTDKQYRYLKSPPKAIYNPKSAAAKVSHLCGDVLRNRGIECMSLRMLFLQAASFFRAGNLAKAQDILDGLLSALTDMSVLPENVHEEGEWRHRMKPPVNNILSARATFDALFPRLSEGAATGVEDGASPGIRHRTRRSLDLKMSGYNPDHKSGGAGDGVSKPGFELTSGALCVDRALRTGPLSWWLRKWQPYSSSPVDREMILGVMHGRHMDFCPRIEHRHSDKTTDGRWWAFAPGVDRPEYFLAIRWPTMSLCKEFVVDVLTLDAEIKMHQHSFSRSLYTKIVPKVSLAQLAAESYMRAYRLSGSPHDAINSVGALLVGGKSGVLSNLVQTVMSDSLSAVERTFARVLVQYQELGALRKNAAPATPRGSGEWPSAADMFSSDSSAESSDSGADSVAVNPADYDGPPLVGLWMDTNGVWFSDYMSLIISNPDGNLAPPSKSHAAHSKSRWRRGLENLRRELTTLMELLVLVLRAIWFSRLEEYTSEVLFLLQSAVWLTSMETTADSVLQLSKQMGDLILKLRVNFDSSSLPEILPEQKRTRGAAYELPVSPTERRHRRRHKARNAPLAKQHQRAQSEAVRSSSHALSLQVDVSDEGSEEHTDSSVAGGGVGPRGSSTRQSRARFSLTGVLHAVRVRLLTAAQSSLQQLISGLEVLAVRASLAKRLRLMLGVVERSLGPVVVFKGRQICKATTLGALKSQPARTYCVVTRKDLEQSDQHATVQLTESASFTSCTGFARALEDMTGISCVSMAFVLLLHDSDFLFAQHMVDNGVEVHILLPFNQADFMQYCEQHRIYLGVVERWLGTRKGRAWMRAEMKKQTHTDRSGGMSGGGPLTASTTGADGSGAFAWSEQSVKGAGRFFASGPLSEADSARGSLSSSGSGLGSGPNSAALVLSDGTQVGRQPAPLDNLTQEMVLRVWRQLCSSLFGKCVVHYTSLESFDPTDSLMIMMSYSERVLGGLGVLFSRRIHMRTPLWMRLARFVTRRTPLSSETKQSPPAVAEVRSAALSHRTLGTVTGGSKGSLRRSAYTFEPRMNPARRVRSRSRSGSGSGSGSGEGLRVRSQPTSPRHRPAMQSVELDGLPQVAASLETLNQTPPVRSSSEASRSSEGGSAVASAARSVAGGPTGFAGNGPTGFAGAMESALRGDLRVEVLDEDTHDGAPAALPVSSAVAHVHPPAESAPVRVTGYSPSLGPVTPETALRRAPSLSLLAHSDTPRASSSLGDSQKRLSFKLDSMRESKGGSGPQSARSSSTALVSAGARGSASRSGSGVWEQASWDLQNGELVTSTRHDKTFAGVSSQVIQNLRQGRQSWLLSIVWMLTNPDAGLLALSKGEAQLQRYDRSSTFVQFERLVRYMLFADVKNYSKLKEEILPLFNSKWLTVVKDAAEVCEPLFLNTWGDGLFVVFDKVVDAAKFATELLRLFTHVEWERIGLPADTNVRVGMHAGPVYCAYDPIIGRGSFFGRHVSLAEEIEPVTSPGCAYASEQFAACLVLDANDRFDVEYIASVDLWELETAWDEPHGSSAQGGSAGDSGQNRQQKNVSHQVKSKERCPLYIVRSKIWADSLAKARTTASEVDTASVVTGGTQREAPAGGVGVQDDGSAVASLRSDMLVGGAELLAEEQKRTMPALSE